MAPKFTRLAQKLLPNYEFWLTFISSACAYRSILFLFLTAFSALIFQPQITLEYGFVSHTVTTTKSRNWLFDFPHPDHSDDKELFIVL